MYTKGEWEAMRGGAVVATWISPITGAKHTQPTAQCYGENEQIQEANANLIAASPRMYEALTIALGMFAALDTKATREIANILRPVLAQADGKE